MNNQYLVLIKGRKPLDYSPEELQKRLEDYRNWVKDLGEAYLGAQRLEPTGAHLTDRETVITDGPVLESNEIIAGYALLAAPTLKAAIALAQSCPLLDHFDLFVRPVIQVEA